MITVRPILELGHYILRVSHDDDGYWQFLEWDTPPDEDAKVVSLSYMVSRDPTLRMLSDLPRGWQAFRRRGPDEPWSSETIFSRRLTRRCSGPACGGPLIFSVSRRGCSSCQTTPRLRVPLAEVRPRHCRERSAGSAVQRLTPIRVGGTRFPGFEEGVNVGQRGTMLRVDAPPATLSPIGEGQRERWLVDIAPPWPPRSRTRVVPRGIRRGRGCRRGDPGMLLRRSGETSKVNPWGLGGVKERANEAMQQTACSAGR